MRPGWARTKSANAVFINASKIDPLSYAGGGRVSSLLTVNPEGARVDYAVAVRLVFRYDRRLRIAAGSSEAAAAKGRIGPLLMKTGIAAAVIVAVGIWLSLTGEKLAAATGWGESFVGSLFLATATSLPEAVVSIGALRLGRADMAVSNLLGSNLFNMLTIALCDLLYRPGALLASVSPAGIMSGLTAIVMTGIVITALVYRAGTKSSLRIGAEAVALGFVYLLGGYFLFVLSSR